MTMIVLSGLILVLQCTLLCLVGWNRELAKKQAQRMADLERKMADLESR